jgi:salicylate hydroxylase
MIRPDLDPTLSHEPAAFTILGDAMHATHPYLASDAGMAIEDVNVLGLCLEKRRQNFLTKRKTLDIYGRCRRERIERVVSRANR